MVTWKRGPFLSRIAMAGVLLLGTAAPPLPAFGYDWLGREEPIRREPSSPGHDDHLKCPRGTTLQRLEINPHACRASGNGRIPITRSRRACCSVDGNPTKIRCLPFAGCPSVSPS